MFDEEMKKLKELYESGCYEQKFYSSKIQDGSVFDSYEKFCSIPFTYKDEIRATTAYERTPVANDEVYGIFSSSGTTGKKTYYIYSKEDKSVHETFVKTFYTELGITPEDLGGVCAPIDTGVMAHTMMWQFTTMGAGYVTCVEPSPDNIAELISTLPVTVIATRPDVVSTLAYSPEWKKAAQDSKVSKLILGGGFLSNGRRNLLQDTWNAKVYNMFGMSEMFGPMAGECRFQDGQHYLNNYLMIELIDPQTGNPVKLGESGVAVYTTLWKKGFPLLRYWTDDVMSITYETCKCGSIFPRLYHHGRLGDCIKIDGRTIFPKMLEEILLSNQLIFDYQVIKSGEKITVFVEKAPDVLVSEECIKQIKQLFTNETVIEFKEPGSLHYTGHGKRFFENFGTENH